MDIYRKAKPQQWELERAAVAIQAAYRGYYVRRKPRDLLKYEQCAIRIQANVRGYQVRQMLSAQIKAATIIQVGDGTWLMVEVYSLFFITFCRSTTERIDQGSYFKGKFMLFWIFR